VKQGRQEEGIRWYKQAADLGCPAGQCNLGLAYMLDSSDLAEAVKWFQLAAEAGHARAQYSLALCLHQGWGVDRNMSKAVSDLLGLFFFPELYFEYM
jgi:TPR repeat protein